MSGGKDGNSDDEFQDGFTYALAEIGRWIVNQPRFADWGCDASLISRAIQAVRDNRITQAQQEPVHAE